MPRVNYVANYTANYTAERLRLFSIVYKGWPKIRDTNDQARRAKAWRFTLHSDSHLVKRMLPSTIR